MNSQASDLDGNVSMPSDGSATAKIERLATTLKQNLCEEKVNGEAVFGRDNDPIKPPNLQARETPQSDRQNRRLSSSTSRMQRPPSAPESQHGPTSFDSSRISIEETLNNQTKKRRSRPTQRLSRYGTSESDFLQTQVNGSAKIPPRLSAEGGEPRPSADQLDQSRRKLFVTSNASARELRLSQTLSSSPTQAQFLSTSAPSPNRFSSPPALADIASNSLLEPQARSSAHHRHTLQPPKRGLQRRSTEITPSFLHHNHVQGSDSPEPANRSSRRASATIGRRLARSMTSGAPGEEPSTEEENQRWTESLRQKRASRRRRKDEEDEDRVLVGTKVDQNHVNWVTAYNMLTGIRYTVSRTNAKLDRDLTTADFQTRQKFSFDITGNELTPSAKYDFKFKDYAPWVFRHLRAKFRLDPADYLISLTSKYILSELGSPGKSGSFFYFSRDYRFIIKTIHHAEHKLLRKILPQYYRHVEDNPNTLISQFYGLHRVKIPYGRKIHFVVMNNLFPPHRDIHQTYDLKGSTVGREFKEEDLAANPRATLKDMNWLNRHMHLHLGPPKREMFLEQVARDVALLQKLKIMDYSLLLGIHDSDKGNEENLRDKTLKVFQPGGEQSEHQTASLLSRTPSKLENVRRARELREIIKKEKPIPMVQSLNGMPDEIEDRKHFTFYADDGGYRASHDDGRPGEEIYYLGIIDCLTRYGMLKRAEHFFKGFSYSKTQISAIPPVPYGERFLKFIGGTTQSPEEVDRESQDRLRTELGRASTNLSGGGSQHEHAFHLHPGHHTIVEQQSSESLMAHNQRHAARDANSIHTAESHAHRSTMTTVERPIPGQEGTYSLPILQETITEVDSMLGGSRSGRSAVSRTPTDGTIRLDEKAAAQAGRQGDGVLQQPSTSLLVPQVAASLFSSSTERATASYAAVPSQSTDPEKAAAIGAFQPSIGLQHRGTAGPPQLPIDPEKAALSPGPIGITLPSTRIELGRMESYAKRAEERVFIERSERKEMEA